jgi:hypothetical protein
MSFNYTITLNDPTNSPQASALIKNITAATASWSSYINGLGSLDIQVNIADTAVGRANGGAATSAYLGMDGSRQVFESATANELRTGKDANGSAADLIINVDPDYLKTLWLGLGGASSIPSDKTDAYSVFAHEIGHGLGISGFRDLTTGSLPGYESTWDRLVTVSGSSASFVGANAAAVNGGPVVVTSIGGTQNYFHLANSEKEANGQDLMNGIVFNYGTRYDISKLDVAIVQDLGLSVTNNDINSTYRFYDTKTGDHFYTTSAYEKQQILKTIPWFNFEGAAWATPDKAANTMDVFRFFDTGTDTHFYTTSAQERDIVIKTAPQFHYEGVGFQAYTDAASAGPGGLTLERFYNTQTGLHHFAANAEEAYGINHGAAGAGWVDEGAAFTVHLPTAGMLYA